MCVAAVSRDALTVTVGRSEGVSVSGNQMGLEDERSGLITYVFQAIDRTHASPRLQIDTGLMSISDSTFILSSTQAIRRARERICPAQREDAEPDAICFAGAFACLL